MMNVPTIYYRLLFAPAHGNGENIGKYGVWTLFCSLFLQSFFCFVAAATHVSDVAAVCDTKYGKSFLFFVCCDTNEKRQQTRSFVDFGPALNNTKKVHTDKAKSTDLWTKKMVLDLLLKSLFKPFSVIMTYIPRWVAQLHKNPLKN